MKVNSWPDLLRIAARSDAKLFAVVALPFIAVTTSPAFNPALTDGETGSADVHAVVEEIIS